MEIFLGLSIMVSVWYVMHEYRMINDLLTESERKKAKEKEEKIINKPKERGGTPRHYA